MPRRDTSIMTTTESEQAHQAPTALFSHPVTQLPSNNAGQGTNQPRYENLFQEPTIPTHRDTLD
jgi:hypothetical protein